MTNLESNKRLVIDFWEALFYIRDVQKAAAMITDDYRQHNPKVMDRKDGFLKHFANIGERALSTKIYRAVAENNLVVLHSKIWYTDRDDVGRAHIDIFRIEGEKIAEHWDVVQEVPAQSANENTMF